jgi:glycosyltransferase involved in cell wall biosynthesis
MKKVFIKTRFPGIPLHSLYNDIINMPPTNYEIIVENNKNINKLTYVANKSQNIISKSFVHYFGGFPYVYSQTRQKLNEYEKYDLIFASQHIINAKQPWVVDFEFANALSGYSDMRFCKNLILKKLSSKQCKFILPFSKWAEETLEKSFDCKEIRDKIRILRPTVKEKQKNKIRKEDESIQILFVGSANPANLNDYEFKGIKETIDAFINLQKKYEKIQLVIRSKISYKIREKIKKFPNIKVIEKILTKNELDELYKNSDISVHIGFLNLNATIFEAMSYGIPVIASSLFNIPELITDMKNGILLEIPNSEKFYSKNGCPKDYSYSFIKNMKKTHAIMTEKLEEALKKLIEDKSLRERIGNEASKSFEKGEFSINNRNKIIKEVFDNAINS